MNKENKKTFDWDEGKTSQFIIWDYIENMNRMGCYDTQNFLTNSFWITISKYKKYKIITDLIDNAYNNFFLRLVKGKDVMRKKILFDTGVKYSSFVLEAKKDYSIVIVAKGRRERLFAAKNFIKYINCTDLYQFVYNYFTKKNEHYLSDLIKKVEEKIKIISPDYIVLWNDSLPIERAIVLVARRLGIITIDIQHGIYQSTSVPAEERAADYVLVLGQYFKDLYVKNGIRKSEEVYILGYPFLIKGYKANCRKKRYYTVCFLGQDFEKYDKNLLNIKLETINNLYKICKHLGLKFIYRPHPGENKRMLRDKLAEIIITPKGEDLEETFERGDIFISFNSTALIEAAIRSKITLQLMNYPMNTDNFENLGVCNKSFVNFKQLADYLEFLSKLPNLGQERINFNNNYIETRYNPNERFFEILNNIERNKNY